MGEYVGPQDAVRGRHVAAGVQEHVELMHHVVHPDELPDRGAAQPVAVHVTHLAQTSAPFELDVDVVKQTRPRAPDTP